ncbi:MAG TPA: hypothetical protein VKD69_10685, partial [Vicinamibacterales bacterium]|nr:hypothetical protein [Vicinamibacterales bacterium]
MVREVLIASAVLMSTGALAAAPQRTMRGAAPPVTTTQTQAPQRTAPPPLPQTVAPPILLPMTPLTPLPAGGLTPPVPFTPTAILPTRDMFRVGRRDPFRNRPLPFPIVSGYGGYGGYGYTTEPQAYAAAAPSEAPVVMGGLRLTGT